MKIENINTLGELKASGYKSKSIKDELRFNLREKIKSGKNTFEGVHGFENTVIPELMMCLSDRVLKECSISIMSQSTLTT